MGTNGRNPEGHAWDKSSLKHALHDSEKPLNIPPLRPLPGRTTPVPFVLTGDETFGSSKYMLRPCPSKNLTVEGRIANYRISRENEFPKICREFREIGPFFDSSIQSKGNNTNCTYPSQLAKS